MEIDHLYSLQTYPLHQCKNYQIAMNDQYMFFSAVFAKLMYWLFHWVNPPPPTQVIAPSPDRNSVW